MFSLVNGVYQAYFATPQLNILVVGAQGSGKTTLMERLKVTEFASKAPKGSGVLTQYSSPLSAKEAKQVFFSDGTIAKEHVVMLEQQQLEAPRSPVPTATVSDAVVLETPDTKRRLAAMATNQRRRFRWICPAPEKYQHAHEDDDDDDDASDDEKDDSIHAPGNGDKQILDIPLPLDMNQESCSLLSAPEPLEQLYFASSPQQSTTSNRKLLSPVPPLDTTQGFVPPPAIIATRSPSMEDVQDESRRLESMRSINLSDRSSGEFASNGVSQQQQQQQLDYNLKKNCKMLPLIKIRPTIGMNLCRVSNICGASCHVMDVGGRMQQLWERYYHDCDAVIFVWKLDDEQNEKQLENEEDDSDSDDERPVVTAQQQLQMLERVRSSIPEDVPFMVLGQMRAPSPAASIKTDRMYSSSCLLPNYHNLYQALYFCNAATGQGVKTALEWLVPLAKRQQLTRVRSSVDGDKF
ncbi:hypothetical protein MPSEU_000561600 [Mayamaea pseudoterrestris]|nr:hypothetical protein MPSEU_000561600 [Mayamaea pseudoterrestris]